MSKRGIILILCLAGLLVCTAVFFSRPNRSPKYEGKSMEAWFREFCASQCSLPNGQHEPHLPSVRAFRALGTNAVPYLLEQCFSQATDSAFETNVLAKLSEVLHPLGAPRFVPAPYVQWGAAEALREIKPPALLLLPPLTNALAGTNRFQRYKALFLLGAIGEGAAEATPWLAQGVRSADFREQLMSLQSIERLGPAVKGVLPDLVTLLTNKPPVQMLQRWVCRDLANLGSNALPAAPILRARLQTETNPMVYFPMLTALCRIDAQAEELNTFLQEMRQETDENKLQHDINLLWDIVPNAKPAIPVLLKLLREDHKHLWDLVAQTLKQLGTGKAEVMPLLVERMQDENPATRYAFAKLTLLFEPGNPAAVALLLKAVQSEPTRRDMAMGELSELGPDAQAAIPLLRQAAASPDKTVREIARKTLKRIEGPDPAN